MTYWNEKQCTKWLGLKLPPFIGPRVKSLKRKRNECSWKLPLYGWFKLNFDGVSRGNTSDVGNGFCIHDALEEEIVTIVKPIGKETYWVQLLALVEGLE